MTTESKLIQQAEFNPKIKTYILLIGCFILLITLIGIPVLIIWLLGLGNYIGKRYHRNLSCKLTENHLEFKKGVFFKVEKTIPLENIQDLTFLENPILNWLELKVLKIETAGNSNSGGSDMKLIGIIDSANFKKKVLDQREVLRNESMGRINHTATEVVTNYHQVLSEIKNLLVEIKNK